MSMPMLHAGALAPDRAVASALDATSPFARYAKLAAQAGLVVLPTFGKRPLLKGWTRHRRPPRPGTIDKWSMGWPDADWGINAGASNLVVVDFDCDDLSAAVAQFGDTPFVVQTGRGFHLYFAHAGGVASRDLSSLGIPAQIKSQGGFVVGWGSQHPTTGREYRIVRGTPDDLLRLPPFDIDALDKLLQRLATDEVRSPGEALLRDGRKRALFSHLRRLAADREILTFDDALAAARAFNRTRCDPPLSDDLLVTKAKGIVTYLKRGTVYPPRHSRRLDVPSSAEFDRLRELDTGKFDLGDAMALLAALRAAHGKRAGSGYAFAIASKAMADNHVISGWRGPKRYTKARNALLSVGIIARTRGVRLVSWTDQDGQRRTTGRSPALYQFLREPP